MDSTVLRWRHSSLQSSPTTPIRLTATSHLPDILFSPNRTTSPPRAHLPGGTHIDRSRAVWAQRRAGRRQSDACARADLDGLRNEPYEPGCGGTCDDEDHEGTEASRYVNVFPASRGDCGGGVSVGLG